MILSLLLSLSLGTQAFAKNEDPFSDSQWGLKNQGKSHAIDLDPAILHQVQGRASEDVNIPASLKKPAKKIIVAVLDTGVDVNHEDLKTVIHRKESECRAWEKYQACLTADNADEKQCKKTWYDLNNPEVDQDKNGYPMDCTGWDITANSVNPTGSFGSPEMSDPHGHGTHVAGIIAAQAQNGIGIAGVSSNIEILPVRVINEKPNEPVKPLQISKPFPNKKPPTDFSPQETGKEPYKKTLGDFITRGVIYAVNSGAQVINLSLGWPQQFDSEYLRGIIAEAQKKGVIFVAAAGNDSTRALLRPCSYPGVICVGSHGPDGSLSHFSNYGSGVTVAAPGTFILSTYPESKRPLRFKKTFGYDYIHGTSQASPFVAGIVGELLAQGKSPQEIYARLVLGSRPLKEKLPLLTGAPGNLKADQEKVDSRIERKWLLAGLADLEGALNKTPEAAILPFEKEKQVISWDRQSKVLVAKFSFKNFWQDIAASQVSVAGNFLKPNSNAVRPQILSLGFDNASGVWKSGEIRNLIVKMQLNDSSLAEDSRIPSDLDLKVIVKTGAREQSFVLESEVIVQVSSKLAASKTTEVIGLQMPQGRFSLISIDENLDGELRTDYLAAGLIQAPSPEEAGNHYHLMRQNANGSYISQGELKIKLGEDTEKAREQITARMNWGGQNDTGYVIGLLIDRTVDQKDSSLLIHYLNSKFELQKTFEIKNEKVKIPLKVAWQKVGSLKAPSWVGIGYDLNKKPSLWEDHENPNQVEEAKTRFYFLNDQGQLQTIADHQGYQFLDVLSPTASQFKAGRVPVILGKNRGTETKPSYLYDFAIAEVVQGKVANFQALGDQKNGFDIYRNLIDTRVDQVLNLGLKQNNKRVTNKVFYQVSSLRPSNDLGVGTFWFGEGPEKTQRVTTLLRTNQGHRFYDATLAALRGIVDAVLQVRMTFWGENGLGIFALTNSEIQFHETSTKKVAATSFERYTFIPSMAFSEFHYPVAVQNNENPAWQDPGLMTTEGSMINDGIKIKMAIRDSQKNLVEIAAPAKLRLEGGEGCKALDQATYFSDGVRAMDFFCGDKLLRMKLAY